MMNQILRFGIAVLMVAVMAGPAFATVDIGGYLCFDLYYYQQDVEGFAYDSGRTTPGSGGLSGFPDGYTTLEDDRHATYFDLNHSTSIRFSWTSDNGVGLYITPYMQGDPSQSGKDSNTYDSAKHGFKVGIANAVGWWDITSQLRIIAGKGGYETIFSDYSPGTTMGYDGVGKVIGYGYGNIGSSFQNGVRFTYKINKNFQVKLGLLESRLTADVLPPDDFVDALPPYLQTPEGSRIAFGLFPYHPYPLLLTEPGTRADNNTVLPKFEVAVPISFKVGPALVNLSPNGMYLQQTFDNIADGADDTITSYGLSLGASVKIKAFELKTEINYGQNLYNAGRTGVATTYPFKAEYAPTIGYIQSARTDANGKIHDSELLAGWVEVNYKIGKFKPALFYGRQEVSRDMPASPYAPGLANLNSEATTQFYGFNCSINLTNHFYLVPEIMIYDNGDGMLLGQHYSFGKELMAGTQFKWLF